MISLTGRKKINNGFVLIEVLLALLITAISITASLQCLAKSANVLSLTEARDKKVSTLGPLLFEVRMGQRQDVKMADMYKVLYGRQSIEP